MANCNELFQHYNRAIKLTDDKRSILISVRDSLRIRMQNNFLRIPEDQRIKVELIFQSQGSFVTDTIIKPINDDFDLDDGVYFKDGLPDGKRPTPQVFHKWVIQAVDKDNEYEKITDKTTCVRVKYKQGFHIDIPIYYADKYESPDLADTKKGWILSNPIEFIAWFEEKAKSDFQKAFFYDALNYAAPYQKWQTDIRKQDSQLRRLVRYMKAWADLKQNEMPCGIIMTILVANNFSVNDRDDVAFRSTLVNIRNYFLSNGIICLRPTSPIGEDLFASTSDADKQKFMSAMNTLIASANIAINTSNQKEAAEEWEKHLGNRFPSQLAKDNTPPPVKREPSLESLKSTVVHKPWSPKN